MIYLCLNRIATTSVSQAFPVHTQVSNNRCKFCDIINIVHDNCNIKIHKQIKLQKYWVLPTQDITSCQCVSSSFKIKSLWKIQGNQYAEYVINIVKSIDDFFPLQKQNKTIICMLLFLCLLILENKNYLRPSVLELHTQTFAHMSKGSTSLYKVVISHVVSCNKSQKTKRLLSPFQYECFISISTISWKLVSKEFAVVLVDHVCRLSHM